MSCKFAVLGHGVVGSGVVELFYKNKASIEKRAGTDMDVKYILDLRDFPDSPYQDKFTKDFIGQCEIEKNTEREGVSLRGGLEYEVVRSLYIRAGVQTNPGILSFGLGYTIRFVQVDVAAQLHNDLGASVQIGMVLSFGK